MATTATITRSQVLNEMKEKLGISNSYCNEIERLGKEIKDSCKTPNIDDFTPIPIPEGFLALIHALDVCLLTNGNPQNYCDKQSWVRTENLSEWDDKNRERINRLDEVSIDKIYEDKDSSTIDKIKSDFRAIVSGNLNQYLCYDFSLMYQLLYSARKSEFYVLHYGTTFEQSLSSVRFFIKLYLKEGHYTPLIYNKTLHSILNNPSYSLVNHLLKLLNKEFVERTEIPVHHISESVQRTMMTQQDSRGHEENEIMYEEFLKDVTKMPRNVSVVGSNRQEMRSVENVKGMITPSEIMFVENTNEKKRSDVTAAPQRTMIAQQRPKDVLDRKIPMRTPSLQRVHDQQVVTNILQAVKPESDAESKLQRVESIENNESIESIRTTGPVPEHEGLEKFEDTVEQVEQLVFKDDVEAQIQPIVQQNLQTQSDDKLLTALANLENNIEELSQSQNQQRINEINNTLSTYNSELEELKKEKEALFVEINAMTNICMKAKNDPTKDNKEFIITAKTLLKDYKNKASRILTFIQEKEHEIEQLKAELIQL